MKLRCFILLFCVFRIFPLYAQWVQTYWSYPYGGLTTCFAIYDSNVFAGNYYWGVFLTTNNGTNWTAVNSGLPTHAINSLAVSGNILYAGLDYNGVYLSTNNGVSWIAANTGITTSSVYSFALSGNNLFAGTENGGVFLSTDNGTNWTAVNTGLTNLCILALAVNGNNLLAGTFGGGVFRSTNSGGSWAPVNDGLTNLYIHYFAVSGNNVFAGTYGGGVFRSIDNGISWSAVNEGLTVSNIYSIVISGNYIFAGTSGGGVFLSTNNGANWTAINAGLTDLKICSQTISGAYLFAGTLTSWVWRRPLSEMIPNVSQVSLSAGWNMMSVPLQAQNMTPQALFPLATSAAYGYNNGYTTEDSLKNGCGYWLRYPSAASVPVTGSLPSGNTIPLSTGWNMIGPFANDIPVANITTTPAGIINSSFYGYENGYTIPTILISGKGYWVRSSQNGEMNLNTSAVK